MTLARKQRGIDGDVEVDPWLPIININFQIL